jgi:methylmalonyl-CoA/ethylmalonyl-CoA epimerase
VPAGDPSAASSPFPGRLDHIGIAVWDLSTGSRFWGDLLGGQYRQGNTDWQGFAFLQFAFPGGGRVELLAPGSDTSGFVVTFLRRFGEGLHHITFVVEDLRTQVARFSAAGYNVFGEDYGDRMEAFVSPRLVGGRLLVQLAQSNLTIEEQDRTLGAKPLASILEAAALRPDLKRGPQRGTQGRNTRC